MTCIIPGESRQNRFKQKKADEIAEEKKFLVLDLMRYVLRYEHGERPSAENPSKHPILCSVICIRT